MQTLEIQVPKNKSRLVKELLKELGVRIKIKKGNNIPNSETISAMEELKSGKAIKFKNTTQQVSEGFKIT